MAITKPFAAFRGSKAIYSNMHVSPFVFNGVECESVEHEYQASKAINRDNAIWIRQSKDPYEAKRRGRTVPCRKDWDTVKLSIMFNLVLAKFSQNNKLARQLKEETEVLTEYNYWHDNFWGSCTCGRVGCGKGKNHLGWILLRVRDALLTQDLVPALAPRVEDN